MNSRTLPVRLAPVAAALLIAAAALVAGEPRAQGLAAIPARPDTLGRLSPARMLADSARRPVTLPPRPVVPPPRPVAPDTSNGPAVPADIPGFWRTRAERTAWKQTADYDETMRYCRQLEGGSRWIKVVTYGTSGQGRDLPLVVVSRDRAFTPDAAHATGKPILLIVNGIHSGEIEGKDASLALVRDMAVLRTRENLLDSCIVLVLPILSVDAHERSSKYNRINQNGPEEMGWRFTPIGLNLNRDWMKTESPEMTALLANVYTKWWPDLMFDDHTTDGADYRHDLSYGFQNGGGVAPSLTRWYEQAFEGRVLPRLAALGHLPAPYLSFRRGADPLSGIDFGWMPPRFSNAYTPLQCRASILVETHMLKPYGVRVKATYDLLASTLEDIREHPGELRAAVRAAEDGMVALARRRGPLVLSSRTTDRATPFDFKGVVTKWEPSDITGGLVPRYTSAPWDTIIPLYRETVPELTVQVPAGYLVPREWSDAIDVLQTQGVAMRRLRRAFSDTVEVQHVLEWSEDARSFEGHHMTSAKQVRLERRLRSFRAGDVWVPADQRSGALVVNLCEAQAPDGFLAWNFFDTVFERKEYGEDYVVEPLAKRMLAQDPALAREFAAKLAADSSFAKSPWARVDFFYRRSPWADPEQDLSPIVRALRPVPESALEPPAGNAPEPALGPRR
ncbi:MAG: M14 family metallopeptidase [Candidatus Eisenbacteria bacterium]|nr:M14 family metallopeptidase [Candidatus Eisenbacteria bacterium]